MTEGLSPKFKRGNVVAISKHLWPLRSVRADFIGVIDRSEFRDNGHFYTVLDNSWITHGMYSEHELQLLAVGGDHLIDRFVNLATLGNWDDVYGK